MDKRIKGEYLEFVSRIESNGSGIEKITKRPGYADTCYFDLSCLSISEGTYIAHGMNSFVVRKKDVPEWEVESLRGDFFVSRKDRTIGEMHHGLSAAEAGTIKQALNGNLYKY